MIPRLLTAAILSATMGGAVSAAPVIDGAVDPTDGWTQVLDDTLNDIQVFIASDVKKLYFGGSTPDNDDGQSNLSGFDDAFNINFGLDGNAAPWRYRLLSQNAPFSDNGGPSTPLDGVWEGFLQGGDDNVVANASFGVPGSLTNLDAAQVDYAVDVNNGRREHEFAIPWTLLLDGQNGWNTASLLDLRVGGFYAEDGIGLGFGASTTAQSPSGSTIDFGDQSTYALVSNVPAAIPLPAPALLLVAGLGALGAMRRLRA